MNKNIRTRFAPSPTGSMHIGNLRTALYAFLFARAHQGRFILRIEDTDQERYVDGATQVIYNTLKIAGLTHDEGPDIGGDYGPYIQSERKNIYRKYAEELVQTGAAYYCFCSKETLEQTKTEEGYNRRCRSLSEEEIHQNLVAGKPYVIRQKMPVEGKTTFFDTVFGEITVENNLLDDQILLKSDGFPTYNFANVVDDHLMQITHVMRGSEYLSSNPKYLLLYQALGWNTPEWIHLPLILGKNADGTVSKLSKRQGATGFQELIEEGYLPEAIVNYIALLGWSPKNDREIFSLPELIESFTIQGINKSPAIFDYQKLDWINSQHIQQLTAGQFAALAFPYSQTAGTFLENHWNNLAGLLQSRLHRLTQIPEMIAFLYELKPYDPELFVHPKNKSTKESSLQWINAILDLLQPLEDWTAETLKDMLSRFSEAHNLKFGQLMWPLRIAVSGLAVTPGGGIEIMAMIGKEETFRRLIYAKRLLN
ncbi:MAG: glutamate--tRNA ligase [Dysgonamonadaceae bacterium]|nr:glutamate--tRNA ligase [Dysgonamonadaceae bacterium]